MKVTTGPRVSKSGARVLFAALLCGTVGWLAAAAFADPPVIYVVFRSDYTFFAYLADGTPVGTTSGAPTTMAAGTYKLILDDTSETDMDFDLAGPGVKLVTDMSHAEEGSAAWIETFAPSSTYTFRDDQHPATVWTFQTSASSVPASGTTTTTCASCTTPQTLTGPTDVVGSQVVPHRGSLAGSVSSSGKLTLDFKGKPVTSLRSGGYAVTVVDKSPRGGFVLQGVHRAPVTLTKPAFVGTRTVTLNLTAGQWAYSTPGGIKSYFIVTTK
jgi:hypothetical protein